MQITNYSYHIAQNLIKEINLKFDYYYGYTENFANIIKNSSNNIIVLVSNDHLPNPATDPNWRPNDTTNWSLDFLSLAKQYPNKKIIIFSSVENLDLDIKSDNLYIIPIGGCITKQSHLYCNLQIVDKNLNSNKTFISLNNSARQHRIILVNYLYGLGLDSIGYISHIANEYFKHYLDVVSWKFLGHHLEDQKILEFGNKKLKYLSKLPDDYYDLNITNGLIDNVTNFEKLRERYQNSFIEIISETTCPETAFLMTEKFLNSVYACNFPILIGSKGVVSFLRNFGFDVFDDIIDHSYDNIDNPIDRIFASINLNLKLLNDVELTKRVWLENKHRLLSNVEFARKGMYLGYENRARKVFAEVMAQIHEK